MPTKKIIDRLKNADPETKKAIFDERADSVNKEKDEKIKKMFRTVFEICLEELHSGEKKVTGINHWYEKMSEKYKETNSLPRVVADYVSGMTDDYLMNIYKEIVIPKSFGISFEEK